MIKAKFWVLTYLFLIPFFALLYFILPAEFHHSTLPNENDVKSAKNEIDREVLKRVQDFGYNSPEPLPKGRWSMVATTADRNEISYWLSFVEHIDDNKFSTGVRQTVLSYSCNIPLNVSGNHAKSYYTMSCSEMSIEDIQDTKFTLGNNGVYRVGFGFAGDEDKELNQLVNDFRLALSGDDSSASFPNRIVRLLYFSTVTHTTLGYGDILPINSTARLLVALQSILGIMVMGLFLNAISKDRNIPTP